MLQTRREYINEMDTIMSVAGWEFKKRSELLNLQKHDIAYLANTLRYFPNDFIHACELYGVNVGVKFSKMKDKNGNAMRVMK